MRSRPIVATGCAAIGAILAVACDRSAARTPASPSCTFAVTLSAADFSAAGGSGAANVTAPAGCGWTASSSAAWITLDVHPDSVGIVVAPYDGSAARSGAVTIASQAFTIRQRACDVQASPSQASVGDGKGDVDITIAAAPSCRWAVEALASWMTADPSSGTGPGVVHLAVAENNETARQQAVRIGGATVTIAQSREACAFALTPSSTAIGVAGGDVSLDVKAGADCSWTLKSDATWIQPDVSSGSGAAHLRLVASSNLGVDDRRARIQVNDATAEISQNGQSACRPHVTPVETFIRGAGGSGDVAVAAEPGCAWTVEAEGSALVLRGPASGSGPGRIAYDVRATSRGPASNFIESVLKVRWSSPTDGENVRLHQFPMCAILSPADMTSGVTASANRAEFPATGGHVHFFVLADLPFSCPWTTIPPSEGWIATAGSPIAPAYYRGDADLGITVADNPSASARSVVMLAAETPLLLVQRGRP